jgi:hypothetical protein
VLCCFTGIARVDGVIHSADAIFASDYELCCRHVFHTWAFRMSSMRGKDTLHSNGGCLRLDAVHAVAWRMDVVSIVNGNVCGRFRDVLAQMVYFLQVHNSASFIAKWVLSSSRLDTIGETNKSLATGTNFDFGLIAMWGRIGRLACMLKIETN